jgi:RNA polymerase sigma-70 factor (ECF subfamily)
LFSNDAKSAAALVTFSAVRQDTLQEATTMTAPRDPDTDELLQRVAEGDARARERLLDRHRQRLRQMIALRLDRRLWARIDPSDVLQETLTEAAQKLSDYVRRRPLPFYPWLHRLASERLLQVHRRHLQAQKRSVKREERRPPPLSTESVQELAERLAARGSSPSASLHRREVAARVQTALAQLAERDRELLVLLYLERMPTRDTAAVLDLSEGAVKMRHLRALERLRTFLDDLAENTP